MQWHLLALHGYQFFDLDGREPDTAMINWTSQGIVPHPRAPPAAAKATPTTFATP